jgi:hypothetical protein
MASCPRTRSVSSTTRASAPELLDLDVHTSPIAFDTGLVHGPEARVVCDYCSGDGEGDYGPCPDCGGEGVLYVLWVNLNVDRVV